MCDLYGTFRLIEGESGRENGLRSPEPGKYRPDIKIGSKAGCLALMEYEKEEFVPGGEGGSVGMEFLTDYMRDAARDHIEKGMTLDLYEGPYKVAELEVDEVDLI